MNIDKIKDFIQILPHWSIFAIYIGMIIILLIIYFKIYYKILFSLTAFTSIQNANEKLFLNKIFGYTSLFITGVSYFFLAMRFSQVLLKWGLIVIWLIHLAYIISSYSLFDYIITVKYAPHLLKEKEYLTLCGEVIIQDGKYKLDSPFILEPIDL